MKIAILYSSANADIIVVAGGKVETGAMAICMSGVKVPDLESLPDIDTARKAIPVIVAEAAKGGMLPFLMAGGMLNNDKLEGYELLGVFDTDVEESVGE